MVASGGGSDANALLSQGFPMVNLANGTERAHEPGERVSVAALEQMLDVALALPQDIRHARHVNESRRAGLGPQRADGDEEM